MSESCKARHHGGEFQWAIKVSEGRGNPCVCERRFCTTEGLNIPWERDEIPRKQKGGTRSRGNERGGTRYRGNDEGALDIVEREGGTRYRGNERGGH